ncbi:MAG: DUF3494 domain-containing protein [Opitutaceae bacterium]|nr:DUF3494 domain-containing protein [Cytophagales bacterium]
MKKNLLKSIALLALISGFNNVNGQAPTLGTAATFALFSSNGAVTNTGSSQVTGNVGSNNGAGTGFGNVNGTMHDMDGTSAKAFADLGVAYKDLDGRIATNNPAPLLGNGQTLFPGVHFIGQAATLNLKLTLDAKGDPNAVFIFKIQGAFASNASAKVILANGAKACNVFWKIEGMVSLASGTTFRGTIIANNAAVSLLSGDTLEGRAFSTTGAVSISNSLVYTPIGCGSPYLTGPTAPDMGSTNCYGLFSANGAVSNSGETHVMGDVGSNKGPVTGFNPLFVSGKIRSTPDNSTQQCSTDLFKAYNYLNVLAPDIELLYPAQFGNNLVLTPHTYLLKGATSLTNKVYLNAEGNANAIFVFKLAGALTTSTYANVILMNNAQSKNVFWVVEGAVTINNYSTFRGTIICNNGALGAINTGVVLDGKAFTTTGGITSTAMTTIMAPVCLPTGITSNETENSLKTVSLAPNPFSNSVTVSYNSLSLLNNGTITIYNVAGEEMMRTSLSNQATIIETSSLPDGIYVYKISSDGQTVQTGRIVSQQ